MFRLLGNICIVVFLLLVSGMDALALPRTQLRKAIAPFEKRNGTCAVVIIKAKTSEIMYVYNREYAFVRRFPPGSIAKLWTAVLLMEYPDRFSFHKSRPVICKGKYTINPSVRLTKSDLRVYNLPLDPHNNRRYFRCAIKKGHGPVALHDAIVQSCNTYFLTSVSSAPHEMYKLLHKVWHINDNCGARIKGVRELPGRSVQKVSVFHAQASAIGEGGSVRVSPLKVCQTYAAFWEETPLLSPFQSPYRGTLQQYPLRISKRTTDTIRAALSQVVHNGTLKGITGLNRKVRVMAGKTGTGTQYKKKFVTHAWNVVYFEYKRATYVMCVFVNRGRGGVDARQLTAEIIRSL